MTFKSGMPKIAGRVRGTPNRITADVREAIHRAFENVGGTAYLEKIAVERPEISCALLGKKLPKELAPPNSGGITVIVDRGVNGGQDRRLIEHQRSPAALPSVEPVTP